MTKKNEEKEFKNLNWHHHQHREIQFSRNELGKILKKIAHKRVRAKAAAS